MTSDKSNNVLKQIEKHYASLSPAGKRIAQYLQQTPLAVISQSTAQIAEKTQTSKATVSRFFRQLGFNSHQQAKDTHLSLREQGVPVHTASSFTNHQEHEFNNLMQTFAHVEEEVLLDIANRLAKAKQVTLIGFRNAYPLALHFRQQLKQIRTSVRLLPQPGQTLGEDIVDLGDDDVVVLLGFRRRTRQFKFVLDTIQHAQVILITDPTGQVYRNQVTQLLVCHLGNDAPFDSYAAPMSLLSTICNHTYALLGSEASNRVNAITNTYASLDELEKSK
jgi:DNA-binding MurR/RpiR family transcriptional regulator